MLTRCRANSAFREDTTGNDLPFEARGLPPEEITLAKIAAKRLSHLHIGKWHLVGTRFCVPWRKGSGESLMMEGGLYLLSTAPTSRTAMVCRSGQGTMGDNELRRQFQR